MAVQIVRSAEKALPTFNPVSQPPTFAFYMVPGQFTKDFIVINSTGADVPFYLAVVVPDGSGGFFQHYLDYGTAIHPSNPNGPAVLQRIVPYRVDGEYIGIGSTASGLSVIVTSAILT